MVPGTERPYGCTYLADILKNGDHKPQVSDVKYRQRKFDVAKVPTTVLKRFLTSVALGELTRCALRVPV